MKKQGTQVMPKGDPKMISQLKQEKHTLAVTLRTRGQTQHPDAGPPTSQCTGPRVTRLVEARSVKQS